MCNKQNWGHTFNRVLPNIHLHSKFIHSDISSISLASYSLNHRRSFTYIRRNILRKIHWKMLILSLVCLGKIGGKLQGQCGVHLMIGVNLQSGFYGR